MQKGYRINAATGIHKGDREYQQDQVALLSHPRVAGCVLGVVADGMGGRSGGRKASDQVMLTARQLFESYLPSADDAPSLLRQIAEEAHIVIRLTAISAEQEPHSTIAMFLINPGGECYWLHAGDSRVYLFRGGSFVKRTFDHRSASRSWIPISGRSANGSSGLRCCTTLPSALGWLKM
jgi:serine/threonine protein phosphatase PrpC